MYQLDISQVNRIAAEAREIAATYTSSELRQLRSELRVIIAERIQKRTESRVEYGRLMPTTGTAKPVGRGPNYKMRLTTEGGVTE